MIAINAQTNKQNAETTMGTDVFVKMHTTKMATIAHLVCSINCIVYRTCSSQRSSFSD